MTRTKGSKNKPKFEQLSFEVPNAIGGGTTEMIDVSDQIYAKQKLTQDEVTNNMEITHALRTINQGNFAEIEQSFKEKFFDNGWKLFATHYIGQISEGIMILYILIREQ